MSPSSEKLIPSTFRERLTTATASLLLLDYDGTLAPFQTERHRAYPYPEVVPLVDRIRKSHRSKAIIITGRPIAELRPLLGLLGDIEIWGSYGLEHQSADGTYRQIEIASQTSALLFEAHAWLATEGMADRTEIKPGGLAVHWRGLPEPEIARLRTCAQAGLGPYSGHSGLGLVEFDGGLELRVQHPSKADVIVSILGDCDPAIPVAFLGDDLADEDAFRVLNSRGLSVLVRPQYRQTHAHVWLRPPHELMEFLQQWLKSISA